MNMGIRSIFVCNMIAAMLTVMVTGETCGYVRDPLAATKDTVVINLYCNSSSSPSSSSSAAAATTTTTTSSHSVPLQLHDNVTHITVQLLHCHTVPVGLFANVTNNLTSVTVASEDAVKMLAGTFDGLRYVKELRLLGFRSLINMSVSLFEPLRNIEKIILDGFGKSNIKLSHFGKAIQKLTNTPVRRIVFNDMRDHLSGKLLEERTMRADDFKIINASVKELIITNTPMHIVGTIHLAFPHLICFYGSVDNVWTEESFPSLWDLILLSDTLNEFILHEYSNFSDLPDLTAKEGYALMLAAMKNYPDLLIYALNRPAANDCAFKITLQLGANISRITVNRVNYKVKHVLKPLCWEQYNKLNYFDLTGCTLPEHFVGFRGLKRLEYLNLSNTRIKSLSNDFLHHLPALKILKLSHLDIGNFIKSTDSNFFAFSPALTEIHLDNCQLTDISSNLICGLLNFQQLWRNDMSKFTRYNVSDFVNSTNLKLLNFSSNNIKIVSQNSIAKLNELASSRPQESKLSVDLSYNDLHCLCNSTHFVKWLQRSGLQADSGIVFPGFDSYTCLYPNGSIVRVSKVIVSELEQQCSVIQTLLNGSDCPCDEKERTRLEQVPMSLDGYFCRNDAGDLVTMKNRPLPSCFNPYLRASFIVPVVLGGILGITVLITVGLLIYYRNSRRVKQVRDCLKMNPVHFVRTALQYVMMQNREEEQAVFQYNMIVFTQNEDRSSVHTHFIGALRDTCRTFITRDDFLGGAAEVDAILESIRVCQWIVPVLTANFLSDSVCVDFISRVQFSRPHALIPVVWEQPLVVTDVAVEDLLRAGEPLYWPGDQAAPEEKRNFWSALLERTVSLV